MINPTSRRKIGLVFGFVIILLLVVSLFLSTSQAQAAVIFTQFTATPGDTQVSVRWTTASEINTNGFYVVASASETGVFSRVSAFIPRQGTGISGASYEFVHTGLTNGVPIYYKLEIINSDLTSIFTGSISATPNLATPTPTMTFTLTSTMTSTVTMTLSPTLSNTPSVTTTPSVSPTMTPTLTLTRTLTITPTKTFTWVPTATRRPATAVPSLTLVRIMSATASRTPTLTGTSGKQPTSAGGGYPNGTDVPTIGLSGTPTSSTDVGGNDNYPGGGGTQSAETTGTGVPGGGSETQGGEFVTQGTPVPFQTPTKGTESKPGVSSGVIGWIIGILVGLSFIGGAVWYYFRKFKNDEKVKDNLFTDDPDN
jgi:hypothetical protein